MCVNFTPIYPSALQRITRHGVHHAYPPETFPGYVAPILRAESHELRADLAAFGLIPAWSQDRTIGRRTYNARSETVASKPSYRTAWRQSQFCLVPMMQFYEPCWDTGKAVRWRIYRQDDQPFAVAAIWDTWTDHETGEIVQSFSVLTINANGHPVMGRFHRPTDERRSLVVVAPDNWEKWLGATPAAATGLMQPMPPDQFTTQPAQQPQAPEAQATLM